MAPNLPFGIKLELSPDWKAVLRHAWSIRLTAIAALFAFAEVVLQLVGSHLPFPPLVTASLLGLASAGALVSRIVAQKHLSGDQNG